MVAFKEQIQRFYRKFAPNKQVDADKLLKKYKGSESSLLSELYIKYILVDEKGYGTGTPFDEAVTRLYARYSIDKGAELPALLTKYQSNPDKLITAIVNKYEFRDVDTTVVSSSSYKSQIEDIYRTANPGKAGDVDALLAKYKGHEGELLKAVGAKYKRGTTSSSAPKVSFKSKITDLYRKYNPGKVGEVDALAAKHKGNQATLLATIEAKYHPRRNELVNLYTKHNPHKVSEVDSLLIKYKGKEEKLIQQVKAKYEGMKQVETRTAAPSFTTPAQPEASQTQQARPATESAPPSIPTPSQSVPPPVSVSPGPSTPTTAPVTEPTVPPATTSTPSEPAIPPTPMAAPSEPIAPSVDPAEAAKEAEWLKTRQNAQAEEEKRKAAAIAVKKEKKAAGKGKTKKMNLTPIIIIIAVIVVLGGSIGGYYYKFGWTIPFNSDSSEVEGKKEETTKSSEKKKETPAEEETTKEEVISSETPEVVAEEVTEEEVVEAAVEPEVGEELAAKPEPKPKPKPKPAPIAKNLGFHLAAGSFTSEENARALHEKLKSQGYNAVYLGKIGAYYKVSYQSFKTEPEAKAALQKLTDKGVSSWLLRHELK